MFSVKKENNHKIYNILGIKLKFKIVEPEVLNAISKAKQDAIKTSQNQITKVFNVLAANSLSVDDKIRFLSQKFYKNTGYYPNFKYPKTFNEKLNWLRYNYTNFEKRKIVADKLLFKGYIEEKLGSGYTTKLLKVFDDVADLNFDGLPDKFVIKTTLGFGAKGVKIVRDKNTADLDNIKFELSETLNPTQLEFGTTGKKQKIIVEEYIEQIDGQVYDYKFFCFNGEPKLIEVIKDRTNGDFKASFYDSNWEKLDICSRHHKNATFPKPKLLDEMLKISKKLSTDFPFMRVDLYSINNKILAGEMTFIPSGGMLKFSPSEWDYKIGQWLDLSKINPEHLRILPEFVEGAKTFLDPQIVESHVFDKK